MTVLENVTHDELERVVNSLKFSVQGYVADAANAVLARIEPRLDSVEAKVDRIEPRLDSFEAKVDRIEPRLDSVEAKV
ncbi:MAG: hypothetical protein OXH86_00615, partial [Acidimicrobiaceae bacterium]|nr:hypothetical protein [Acidimicrobiaceae bacterium]